MVWSNASIVDSIAAERIRFTGAVRSNGLLLTAAPVAQRLRACAEPVDLYSQEDLDAMYEPILAPWETLTIAPSELILIQAAELVALCGLAVGVIGTLSHLARCGLLAHLASPFVGPEFDGHLTLEVRNSGPAPLTLHAGMPLAKVVLFDFEDGGEQSRRSFYGELGVLGSRYAMEFGSRCGGVQDV